VGGEILDMDLDPRPVGSPIQRTKAAGIRERRPHVVDIGVEAVLHANDALAVC